MYKLSTFGFDPFFEEQLQGETIDKVIPARISAEHRSRYEVWSNEGTGFAQLAGRLLGEHEEETNPGVGDWVALRSPPSPDHVAIIERVFKRRTVFIRGAAGREARGQVVAANVDLVFVVCGLDADYNVRRIERYLARVWASGAQPSIILNKADVCEDTIVRVAEIEGHCPGVPVYVTSALHSEGLQEIRGLIPPGLTAAFVGSSGAGKSTLVNKLLGEERMETGEVRARDGRGCHITSHRQLVLLPGGGLLLDTPGMRELQLFDDEGISMVFPDIEELSKQCRFRDCRHDSEPGCAVMAAIAAGQISAERREHYLKLGREAKAYELRKNEHLRRKTEKVWGQLYDEGARIRRWKRSE
ncbi:MAG: ribosome small subunit-dependent GTPase A [Proteobacteria bacterium]|nr:ribosome small subunit-dependent GTPase A [Pseudomonadota bacterium]